VNNRISRIQPSTGIVTPVDLNPGINHKLPNAHALSTARAQPAGVRLRPGRQFHVRHGVRYLFEM